MSLAVNLTSSNAFGRLNGPDRRLFADDPRRFLYVRRLSGAVEMLLSVVGPDRICFGSDAPLYHPAPFVRMLEMLSVSEEVRNKIAFRNALTVIPALASRLKLDRAEPIS